MTIKINKVVGVVIVKVVGIIIIRMVGSHMR